VASYRVVVRDPGRDIEAFSATRLSFEPQGPMKEFRRELSETCRSLIAGHGERLQAVYTSAVTERVDLENVLTYNLGTGAISAAARHGLVLERCFEPTGDTAHPHHHRYRLDTLDGCGEHWTADEVVGSVALQAPLEAFREPKAGHWWLLAARAGVDVSRHHGAVPERYGLRVSVTPPHHWRGSLADLLKPLVDGLVSAMHAHDGPLMSILERAAVIHPELTTAELQHHLTSPATPLGPTRLVVPWRHTLQWLPADDHIVLLDARIETERRPGTVNADVHLVAPCPGSREPG